MEGKRLSKYNIITIGMLFISVICIAFFWISAKFSLNNLNSQTVSLNEDWYYFNNIGMKVFVTLPCKIETGNTLELFYDGKNKVKPDTVLATYAAVYDVEIYAGSQLLYQFQDNNRAINDAVRGNIVCSAVIPEGEVSKNIRVIYHNQTGNYNLGEITISTEKALIFSVFIKNLFCMVIPIAMIIIGILALAFYIVLTIQKGKDKRILCIALFLISCGLWCLSDSAFIQMLADYSSLIFTLDFYFFMLMPIPLAYFVLSTSVLYR